MLDLYGFGNQLLLGAGVTLVVTALSFAMGLAIGVLGATAKLYGVKPVAAIAELYTTIVRGIPDLLMIFIFYFGGMAALSKMVGEYVEVSAFAAGVTSLGFIFGAYATEIFRGAVLAVPPGQVDAARAIGLGSLGVFFLVVLPQAWRYSLPALGNQSVALLKQTSLISVIGLEELMRKSAIGAGANRDPFTFYLAAALMYLVMSATMTVLYALAQKRADRGIQRN